MSLRAIIHRGKTPGIGIVSEIREVPNGIIQSEFVPIEGISPIPEKGWFYDFSAGTFSQSNTEFVANKQPVLSDELWYARVTNEERGTIYALMDNDAPSVTLTFSERGRLKAFLLNSANQEIALDGAETEFVFNTLETAGAIDPGRAAEILG